MRYTITLIALLFLNSVGYSANLSAFIDYCRFELDDSTSYVEFYFGIDASTVAYIQRSNGAYQAEVFASIQLKEGDKVRYFEKFSIQSPEVSSLTSAGMQRFNFSKRIATNKTILDCEIVLKDRNSKDTSYTVKLQIDNRFATEKVTFSDIQLLSNYAPSEGKGDFIKSGYQLNPLTSNFYPDEVNSLKYYVEIYNTDTQFPDDEFVVFTNFRTENGNLLKEPGKFKRHSSKPVIGILGQIDITTLPSGSFFFIVEVRDNQNELISFTKKYIQRVNKDYQLDEPITEQMYVSNFTYNLPAEKIPYYMECLRPIASEVEMNTIRGLITNGDSTQQRNYLFDFWYSRYKGEARKEWIKYERNIQKVDEQYSCFGRPGYLTEQGRVTLKYGAPNRIENEFTDHGRDAGTTQKEFQIWYYYTIGTQRNKVFVFQRAFAGRCDYDLIHSNMQGELQNQDWMNNNLWNEDLRQDQSGEPNIYKQDVEDVQEERRRNLYGEY